MSYILKDLASDLSYFISDINKFESTTFNYLIFSPSQNVSLN